MGETRRLQPDSRIKLNIGGEIFETTVNTLTLHPKTKLSELTTSDPSYDQIKKEYYFDRSPALFVYILEYYRCGELHFPRCLCGAAIKKELDFWNIPETAISECCWIKYQEFHEESHSLEDVSYIFDDPPKHQYSRFYNKNSAINQARHQVWLLLEWPSSSYAAKVWSVFFMLVVLLSIAIVCCDTHPYFRIPVPPVNISERIRNLSLSNPKLHMFYTTELQPELRWTDSICTYIFVTELVTKLFVWPHHKIRYINFYNCIDIFSVLPMFALDIIEKIDPQFWVENDLFFAYILLSLCSVLRAFRVMKIAKYNRGLQIIFLAIKSCWKELFLLVVMICIGIVMFSTMIYYAEFHQEDNNFSHIPIGFWWSVVTMTTVGYGDKHPSSGTGYVVGGICALIGMLITGLPIPLIANSFNLYYTSAKIKSRLRKKHLHKEHQKV